jgi:hypothetical protein
VGERRAELLVRVRSTCFVSFMRGHCCGALELRSWQAMEEKDEARSRSLPVDGVRAREPADETRGSPGGAATVDEMSEWSFPASDPPATWTWELPEAVRRRASGEGGESQP